MPKGRRSAEMVLVRMLKKHISWADVKDITDALWRIGFIADQLEEEKKLYKENCENKS